MYIIKQLKTNFKTLIFLGFEKMGENGPRLESEYKEKEVPKEVKGESLKKLLEKSYVEPKLKTNTQIVKEALGPDYIGKDEKDLREMMGEKTKEELKEEKEQFGFSNDILKNLTEKEKESLSDILGKRTINQATSGEIYTLKQEGFDLAKIFLKNQNGEFSKGKGEYKVGDSFEVEFYGNTDIDRIVGIGDILDINNVSKVSVNGVNGKRKSHPRPGFYAGRYLAIHDNFKVNILEEGKFEGEEFNNAIYDRFSQVRGKELKSWVYSNLDSGDSSMNLPFKTHSDKELFGKYINDNFKNDLKYDIKTNIISTTDGKSLKSKQEIISSSMIPKNASELMNIPGFKEKLDKVCSNLGINKNDLLVIIGAECNFNYKAVNSSTGASGLIQFMSSTAKGLGTTVSAIRQMGAVEQLTLVEKYFEPYKGKLNNVVDLYKVVFFPISLNKPNSWVFRSNRLSAGKVANQNPAISKHSTRSDGLIDGYAFKRYVMAKVSSTSVVYEDKSKGVSDDIEPKENKESSESELLFNSIVFYHNEVEKSFEQFRLSKDNIIKAGKLIIERGGENLTNLEITKIKNAAKNEYGDKIKIVLNIDKAYGGQIDV